MRQEDILYRVFRGDAELTWVDLPGTNVRVTSDAVKLDGVRVTVSAETAQWCADLLSASLTTPLVEDLIHRAATHKPCPVLMTPDASWEQTIRHSRELDAQLPDHRDPASIVAPVGKSWVVGVPASAGRAVNYGYHDPRGESEAVIPGLRVWQPPATAHSLHHHDYSQTLRLCQPGPGEPLPHHMPKMAFERYPTPRLLPHDVLFPDLSWYQPLSVRALRWCLFEAARWGCSLEAEQSASIIVPRGRVAEYFEDCARDGQDIGDWLREQTKAGKKYHYCAAAQGWAEHQVAHDGDDVPTWRAGVLEIMRDARDTDTREWHPVDEVRRGDWQPFAGCLAISKRGDSGSGHVERVIRELDDEPGVQTIGANEGPQGGQWQTAPLRYDDPRLLGFVSDCELGETHWADLVDQAHSAWEIVMGPFS